MDYDKRIVTLKEIQVSENIHLYLSLSFIARWDSKLDRLTTL